MKLTTKIYHILHAKLQKVKKTGTLNENYLQGYNSALVDSLKTETEINKGRIDYKTINGKGYIFKPNEA